jgi:membrane associated rhomboid family serine protease
MVVNTAVVVLLLTVLTAPAVTAVLQFEPGAALRRPWTFVSYMVAHAGVLHLALNLVLLNAVGPAVERRLGGRGFLLFYVYCGVGAALFAAGLSPLTDIPPMIGASGAVLGVVLAFAMFWPDAEITLLPLPVNVSAKSLLFVLIALDLVLALAREAGIAHLGHLGGLAAAYVFLRLQTLTHRAARKPPAAPTRRAVLAPISASQGRPVELRPAAARQEAPETISPEELDRVLDKISASGLESLTAEERRFLDEAAQRKRREVQ